MTRKRTPLDKELTEQEIIKALVTNSGLVSKAAETLGVHYSHIYRALDSYGIRDKLKTIRKEARENWLDTAECNLSKIINLVETRPDIALKGIQYFLDNQGQSRGYGDAASSDVSDVREAFRSFNINVSTKSN